MASETLPAPAGADLWPVNPGTGAPLGALRTTPVGEVPAALARARAAQRDWAAAGFAERREALLSLRDVIGEEADGIADVISRDNGKPTVEAYASEIIPICYLLTYFARKAEKFLRPERIPLGPGGLLRLAGKRSWIEYEPWGVVGVISPWNYPFSLAMGEIVMALAAGNAVLNKPSEYTPLVGLKVGELFEQAGFRAGLVTILSGDGRVGGALIEARPDKVCFTGSVRTGRKVAARCGELLIPCTLELGGKDPAIVLDDADLDIAVAGVVWGAMQNAGQTCAAVERCYVHRSLYEPFVERATALAARLRLGAEGDERDMGSMCNEMQWQIVAGQVARARAAGATVHCGGEPAAPGLPAGTAPGGGWFYPPTVLTNLGNEAEIMQEETFGPVLPILPFDTDDEAAALANDSAYGLCASIWSRDRRRAAALASRLVAGTVTINDVLASHAHCETPWFGVKHSGLGWTHGKMGLQALCRKRHVQSGPLMRQLWWYPYSEGLTQVLRHVTQAWVGRGGLGVRLRHLRQAARAFGRHRKTLRAGARAPGADSGCGTNHH